MNPDKKTALLMIAFVVTVFVLVRSILLPTTINVVVEGSDSVVTTIPGFYTLADCAVIAAMAFLLGAMTIFLYRQYAIPPRDNATIHLPSQATIPEIQGSVQVPGLNSVSESIPENSLHEGSGNLLNLLKGNERGVMEALMKYGEMNQADLSSRTGIPKSTLSRTLQNLEDRKLIHRYENGMSKMVKPEVDWNNFGEGPQR